MKRFTLFTFIACALIASLGNAAWAQSAPATLTDDERKEAIKYLEETRKNFLAEVKGLSEAQWTFKAAPDRWSVAEVAEHIAVSEETLFGMVTDRIMKSPATPEKKEAVKGKEVQLRQMITNRTVKAQAPEMLKPTNRWATQAELVKAFSASRDKTAAYVKSSQDDLRSHFAAHPVFKDLDAYQWIILIAGHSARHTDQIKEVKADPNFPKK
ncbi:MAG: DinB family protein [Acidobacteria bacterium]|nr:DinB family protein [Acidobacteriota bacterium]MBI3426458.1 DinB family protein [Acidobacteriota bacterium]